jgi:hypothetical protein
MFLETFTERDQDFCSEVLLMSLPIFVVDVNLTGNPRADCRENYAEDDPANPDEYAREPLDG